MNSRRRKGFSLLEVMLATTVLLGSVIVMSHIAFVGTAHMDSAEQYAAAQLVCQTRMNEMLAGAAPLQEVSNQPIAELPGWGLTVKVSSAGQPGLVALEVTASEQIAATMQTAVESSATTGSGKQFTLVRWIAQPEGSQTTRRARPSRTAVPVDVPGESFLPGEPFLPEDGFMPEAPLLPEEPSFSGEPSLFDEPMPEF